MPERRQAKPPAPSRRERLAVNLFDLDRVDPFVMACMGLRDKLDLSKDAVIRVDPHRPDETAVPFACDLLTAGAMLDVLRNHDRQAGDHPCRAYLRRAAAWERLPADALLTAVVGGRVVLNPKLFADAVEPAPSSPLATGRVELGEPG